MSRRFLGTAVFLLTFVSSGVPALAYNQRLTIYATVPPLRAIYLDAAGNITKVGGNTTENIQPTVYDISNNSVPMSESIQKQYQQFLSAHSGHLDASKIYNVNPVTINLAPNTQTISIDGAYLTLGISKAN